MAIQNKYTIKGASIILCTFSNPTNVKISVGGWLKLALGKFGPLVTMVLETIKNHTQYMKHFFFWDMVLLCLTSKLCLNDLIPV